MKKTILALLLIPALGILSADGMTPTAELVSPTAQVKVKSKVPRAIITMENGGKIEIEFFPFKEQHIYTYRNCLKLFWKFSKRIIFLN